jgi:DNA-directed RNA polymerase specialized sigma24 family protein
LHPGPPLVGAPRPRSHERRPVPAGRPGPDFPQDPRAAEEEAHVRRAIAGDRSALEWLVGRFRPFALRVALGLVGNLADAEDVCQEALATVVQRIGQCRQPECLVAWLLRIVRNRPRSHRRRPSAGDPMGSA